MIRSCTIFQSETSSNPFNPLRDVGLDNLHLIAVCRVTVYHVDCANKKYFVEKLFNSISAIFAQIWRIAS